MKIIICLFLCSLFSFANAEQMDCGEYDGIKLPCWKKYLRKNEGEESLPYFPYAKRPNGCSVLNLPPGTMDTFEIFDDLFSFKDSCVQHDACYYTLHSDPAICNKFFLENMTLECSHGTKVTRPLCMARAKTFHNAVLLSSSIVHAYSQSLQIDYLDQVGKYIEKSR